MGVLVNLPSTLSVGGVHARLNAALNLIALSSTPYSRGIRRCRMFVVVDVLFFDWYRRDLRGGRLNYSS